MHLKGRNKKLIVMSLLGLALLGCGKEEKAPEKKVVRTITSMDIDSLNPYKLVSSGSEEIMMNVFEGLVMPTVDGGLAPAVAKEYKISDDGLTYTFEIREGIKFHNGNPLDVKDVEFSLRKMSGREGDTPAQAMFSNIDDIKITGDNEITITLKVPDSAFIYYMTEGIVPDENRDSLDKEAIGTGPFKVSGYDREQKIILTKNDDYWGEKAKIDEVDIFVTPNAETAFLKLLSGEIDILPRVDSKRLNELKNFKTISGAQNTVQLFALNNKFEPFSHKEVREAINLAVDKDAVIKNVMGGYGIKLETNMSPVMKKYCIDNIGEKRDVEKAKELLKKAGYENLKFTVKVPSNYAMHVSTAQVIAEQLKEVGITMNIETVEWATWLSEVYSGRKYEATIVGLTGKLDPDSILKRYASNYPRNFFNYENPKYDKLIADAKITSDENKRIEYYKEAQRILRDENAALNGIKISEVGNAYKYRTPANKINVSALSLIEYSTIARNAVEVSLKIKGYVRYLFHFIINYKCVCPINTENVYIRLYDKMRISFEDVCQGYLDYRFSEEETEKKEFLQFAHKYEKEIYELLKDNSFEIEDLKKFINVLYKENNGFDYVELTNVFEKKIKSVTSMVEDMLKSKEKEVRSKIEELAGAKSKITADTAMRLIRIWDNDKIEKDLRNMENIAEITEYIENLYTKTNDKNTPYAKEIDYGSVRIKDSEEKISEKVMKYFVSEYIVLKDLYIIKGCKRIQ